MAEKKKKTETPKTPETAPAAAAAGTHGSTKALARYLMVSPRKVRLVINEVRHKPVERARRILMGLSQKGARLTEKLLKSAVANAKVLGLDQNRLYISDIRADQAPSYKRFRPRSMGRADRILKRSTHLSLTLSEGDRVFAGMPPAAAEGKAPETAEKSKPKKTKVKAGKA